MSETSTSIKKLEYVHIPLWLIKDTCWMLELKLLGTLMILPTILVAGHLVWKTRGTADYFVNLAVMFWISANAWWMCCEFYNMMVLKNLAGIPFFLGMLSMAGFYIKREKK
jgi:hypothetical protein